MFSSLARGSSRAPRVTTTRAASAPGRESPASQQLPTRTRPQLRRRYDDDARMEPSPRAYPKPRARLLRVLTSAPSGRCGARSHAVRFGSGPKPHSGLLHELLGRPGQIATIKTRRPDLERIVRCVVPLVVLALIVREPGRRDVVAVGLLAWPSLESWATGRGTPTRLAVANKREDLRPRGE